MSADSDKSTKAPTTTPPKEFSAALLDIDKGRVHDDATARLAELVEAVARTAGKGVVSLKITVEPFDPETFDETGQLMLSGDVSVAVPRPKRAASIFWIKGKNGLTRDDPDRDDPRG